jgi:Arrestin (or S-antigen), N-terminal domain
LILDKPVKTQFVILQLTGLLSVSMVREKVEYVILDEEIVLWGTKIHAPTFDRTTYSRDVTMEYDTPKKHKDEWDTGIMEEGEHPFPFELELPPKSMPSSIDVISFFNLLIIVWERVYNLYHSMYPSTTSYSARGHAK